MTDDNESESDGESVPSLRDVVSMLAPNLPNPLHIVRAGLRGLDAAFDAVRIALEADEEATVDVLKNHDDPVDTLVGLVRIMQGEHGDG